MHVPSFKAEGEFVGHGLADQRGAGRKRLFDDAEPNASPVSAAPASPDCRRRCGSPRRRSDP